MKLKESVCVRAIHASCAMCIGVWMIVIAFDAVLRTFSLVVRSVAAAVVAAFFSFPLSHSLCTPFFSIRSSQKSPRFW